MDGEKARKKSPKKSGREHHRTITVLPDTYELLDKRRQEYQKRLGVPSLSWNQFLHTVGERLAK